MIKIVDIKVEWSPKIKYSIIHQEVSSIDVLETTGDLQWNDCSIIVRCIDKERCIEVIAGEGDYGSDGFVGVINLNSRKLIWLAFFNCSNPFNELEIKGEEIYASSTIGCLWKFKIKDPIDFVVEYPVGA